MLQSHMYDLSVINAQYVTDYFKEIDHRNTFYLEHDLLGEMILHIKNNNLFSSSH